jgi:hypothetical protein
MCVRRLSSAPRLCHGVTWPAVCGRGPPLVEGNRWCLLVNCAIPLCQCLCLCHDALNGGPKRGGARGPLLCAAECKGKGWRGCWAFQPSVHGRCGCRRVYVTTARTMPSDGTLCLSSDFQQPLGDVKVQHEARAVHDGGHEGHARHRGIHSAGWGRRVPGAAGHAGQVRQLTEDVNINAALRVLTSYGRLEGQPLHACGSCAATPPCSRSPLRVPLTLPPAAGTTVCCSSAHGVQQVCP